jgi:hypothetical protein
MAKKLCILLGNDTDNTINEQELFKS